MRGFGDFLVVVDLDGIAWRDAIGDGEGVFGPGDQLRTPIVDFDIDSRRDAHVTPLTTLLMAVADGLRLDNEEFAVVRALDSFVQHLGFDPVSTAVDRTRTRTLSDEVTHALVLDAFASVAERAAREAGTRPGAAISPPVLLAALLDDASGGTPPGRFDGIGREGPIRLLAGAGQYVLGPATLQSHWADAVLHVLGNVDRWEVIEIATVRPLLTRLRCSGASMFEPCEQTIGPTDLTPPVFDTPEPPDGAEISGIVEIRVIASDPESGVSELTLAPLREDGRPLSPYRDRDDRSDVVEVVIDTMSIIGTAQLSLIAQARNGHDVVAALPLQFEVRNLGRGELSGRVVKGPAINVAIAASGLRDDGTELPLAAGHTDADGAFSLQIAEWQGPILVVASDAPDHPAASEAASAYADEARDRPLGWGTDATMAALLPHFLPEDGSTLIVSPLTDLALAHARAISRRGGEALLSAYDRSLWQIGVHFGLQSPHETILHVPPTAPGARASRPPLEADLYLLALACLSQQAYDVAQALYLPDAIDNFTALHLLEAWREDVSADGFFDGRVGLEDLVLERGPRQAPLRDAFRFDLAAACARWLQGDTNHSGITTPSVVDTLQAMSLDESDLFNTRDFDDPTPFDDEGPEIEIDLLAGAGEIGPDGRAVAGSVTLRVSARDSLAGIGVLDVTSEVEWPPDALEVLSDGPGEVLREQAIWAATLHTERIPDGALDLQITAADALDNLREASVALRIDNTPPRVELRPPPEVSRHRGRWYTAREQLEVEAQITEIHVDALTVGLAGEPVPAGPVDDDGITRIAIDLEDGEQRLRVTIVDAMHREATVEQTIVLDTNPPSLTLSPPDAVRELGTWYAVSQPLDLALVVDEPNLDTVGATLEGAPVELRSTVEDHYEMSLELPAGREVELVLTAIDYAGHQTTLRRALVFDDAAPRLTLRLHDGIGVVEDTWYTARDRIGFELHVDETYLDALDVRVDDEAVPVSLDAGGRAELELELGPDERTLQLHVSATDLAGHSAELERTLIVDHTPPVLQLPVGDDFITVGDRLFTAHARAELVLDIAEPHLATLSAEVDEFEVPLEPLEDHHYALQFDLPPDEPAHLRVDASDHAGNTATLERVITSDAAAPIVRLSLVNPALVEESDGVWYTHRAQLDVRARIRDATLTAYTVRVDATPRCEDLTVPIDCTFTVDLEGEDRTIELSASATDALGRTTEHRQSLTLDRSPPTISLTPGPGAVIDGENWYTANLLGLGFELEATDDHMAQIEASFGGAPIALEFVADGQYRGTMRLDGRPNPTFRDTLEITATDRAGNRNTATQTIVADPVPPAITLVDPPGIILVDDAWLTNWNNGTVSVRVADVALAELTATLDGRPLAARLEDNGNGNATASLALELPEDDGPIELVITAADRTNPPTVLRKALIVDRTDPVVTFHPFGDHFDPEGRRHTKRDVFGYDITVVEPHQWSLGGEFGGQVEPIPVRRSIFNENAYSGRVTAQAGGSYEADLTVTAHDLLGQSGQATMSVVVDRDAPVIEFAPIDSIPRVGGVDADGNWHTNASAAFDVPFTVTEPHRARLTAQLDDEPLEINLVADGGGNLEVLIPAQPDGPVQRRTLRITALDYAGNETELTQTIVFDREPPTLQRQTTDYIDEIELAWRRPAPGQPPILDAPDAPRTPLEDGIRIRKLQTTWSNGQNPLILRWRSQDQRPDAPSHVEWRITTDHASDFEWRNVAGADPVLDVELTADVLGISPVDDPPANVPILIHARAVDTAGNFSELDQVVLLLDVLSPPLFVELVDRPAPPRFISSLSMHADHHVIALATWLFATAISLSLGCEGDRGPVGPKGTSGLPSEVPGPAGDRGARGPEGPEGPRGATGPSGLAGPRGEPGPPGSEGQRGMQGPQGLPGDRGPEGAQGPPGAVGPQGVQGPIGPEGAEGPPGEPPVVACPQGTRRIASKSCIERARTTIVPEELSQRFEGIDHRGYAAEAICISRGRRLCTLNEVKRWAHCYQGGIWPLSADCPFEPFVFAGGDAYITCEFVQPLTLSPYPEYPDSLSVPWPAIARASNIGDGYGLPNGTIVMTVVDDTPEARSGWCDDTFNVRCCLDL